MDFQQTRRYIGNLEQLFTVKEYRLSGGAADGMRLVDIDDGAGLALTLAPDRGLDIYKAAFKGVNLGFITPTGLVNAAAYSGDRFLERFFGGFLTTCGLENIGAFCVDEKEALPIHGSYSTLPADRLTVDVREESGVPEARVKGTMNSRRLFGRKLSMTRSFAFQYGKAAFTLEDSITNHGTEPVPLMLLYHFNMGYPLLSEDAKLYIPSKRILPRDDDADASVWDKMAAPAAGFKEMCYYHALENGADGRAVFGVDNPACGISLRIKYDAGVLDHFVQWRMLGEGEYVTGLEPCNATIGGRDKARADGTLKSIGPGQTVRCPFEVTLRSL